MNAFEPKRYTIQHHISPNSPLGLGILLGGVAILGGAILALGGPLAGAAVLAAIVVAGVVLQRLEIGFWGVIVVICLLPFATLPFDIGLTPTFLDMALGAVVGIWFLRIATGQQRDIVLAPVTLPLLLFMILAIFAFIFGLPNGPLTPTLLRKFAELLLSMGFVIVVVDYCRTWEQVERLVKVLMLSGAAASAVAIGLWLIPEVTANSFLNALTRLGYPGGWVIRYIEENPENAERAIGTSVDPNVLGGLLLMMGSLIGPQIVAKRPLFKRWMVIGLFGLVVLALVLTFSRSAMLGLVSGLGFVAVLRYRRLLPYMLLIGVILLFMPFSQVYISRFIEGFQGADLATQMRFGEYKDAFILIQRYPLFGVGFSGAPDLDIYLGVASLYLTIAQMMGLLGLVAFFAIVLTVFGYAFVNRHAFKNNEIADPVWLGLHAALVGGLVAGVLDHYLFNMEFHHAVTVFWLFIGLAVASTRLGSLTD